MHVYIYYIRIKSISTHNKHEVLVQGVKTIQFPVVKTDLLKPCATNLLMVSPVPSKIVNDKLIFHKNQ